MPLHILDISVLKKDEPAGIGNAEVYGAVFGDGQFAFRARDEIRQRDLLAGEEMEIDRLLVLSVLNLTQERHEPSAGFGVVVLEAGP